MIHPLYNNLVKQNICSTQGGYSLAWSCRRVLAKFSFASLRRKGDKSRHGERGPPLVQAHIFIYIINRGVVILLSAW